MKYFLLLASFLALISCKKEVEEKKYGSLELRLIDSPAEYEHVYLDIQGVEVNHSVLGWLNGGLKHVGVYDVLTLNNGLDTLLASNTFEVGKITQVRLVLGSNNSLVKNGITYPLTVPSGSINGLKVNIQQDIIENSTQIRWIDFDAYRSIVQLGNGNYILKPVLRSFDSSENGIIKGSIIPSDADPLIYAIFNGDTITAIPEASGMFQFNGMNGSYDLYFVPFNTSYTGFSLLDQQVSGGQTVDLGAFSF